MQYKAIFRLLGILLLIFSQSMLTPLLVNVIFKENVWMPFIVAYFFSFSIGVGLWLSFKNCQNELKIRDGFILIVLFWLAICYFASIPFLLEIDNLTSVTDAIFETVSGITTTGASVINNLDALPHAILYYRQQLQFIGGIGIVILAVAILPMLGVGGMQLFRTETPGPMKDAKLTPRITQSAKIIWSIYLLLTILCIFFYYLCGMSFFDAIGESFGTVSTGGFTMHSSSFAYYDSDWIRLIACVFMVLGATNFSLHFLALKNISLKFYWQDEEFRFYLTIILVATCIIVYTLIRHKVFGLNLHTFITGLFTTISLATTTGFDLENITPWRTFAPFLAMILMLIGGSAGSTGGGIKVVRALLIFKQSRRELLRMLHPQAIVPIKLGKTVVSEVTIQSIWGFVSTFIGLYLLFVLVFMSLGYNIEISFAAITSSLTNSGFGIDNLKVEYSDLDVPGKWLLIVAMLTGRLEILSVLILFTPAFWRK
ncbi:MAG: potassium transporter [Legionellales bacterium RIFCSPHIGHO2_12_FULL_35_11]|nr:MAG: potassium transporter [Legionellales bacterium RIFCSPHIGHO2_12_FULL_35_11]